MRCWHDTAKNTIFTPRRRKNAQLPRRNAAEAAASGSTLSRSAAAISSFVTSRYPVSRQPLLAAPLYATLLRMLDYYIFKSGRQLCYYITGFYLLVILTPHTDTAAAARHTLECRHTSADHRRAPGAQHMSASHIRSHAIFSHAIYKMAFVDGLLTLPRATESGQQEHARCTHSGRMRRLAPSSLTQKGHDVDKGFFLLASARQDYLRAQETMGEEIYFDFILMFTPSG